MDVHAERSRMPRFFNNTSDKTPSEPKPQANDTEEKYSFRWYNYCLLLYSILTYVGDVVLDLMLAESLYRSGQDWYFGLTLAFIVIPALIMVFFSLKWYYEDTKRTGPPKFTIFGWIVRIYFHFLFLGPVVRYVDSLRYGHKHRKLENKEGQEKKREQYHNWIKFEEADAGYLRLFEGFIEAAPQTLLQLYILVQPDNIDSLTTTIIRTLCIAFSLFSLSSGLTTQQRSMRLSQKGALKPTYLASFVQFLWYFFTTISRMLSLGLFNSQHPKFLALIFGTRWLLTTVWLFSKRTTFFDSSSKTAEEEKEEKCCNIFVRKNVEVSCVAEFVYKCALGVVFLFAFVNPFPGDTRWRYTVYYITIFIENAVLISVWYASVDVWYSLPAILVVFLSFFMGIAFMWIYYLKLHPRQDIEICPRKQKGHQASDEEVPLQTTMDTSVNTPNSNRSLDSVENLQESHANYEHNGQKLDLNGYVQGILADLHHETNV